MRRGQCKLCLKVRSLHKSHLIPRAAYALCRAKKAQNRNPLLVTYSLAMQTSRQTQAHLLCFKCEQLLREKGEDWVLPRLARYGENFPLGEALQATTPLFNKPEVVAYTLDGSTTIRASDLTHFAMGIFWKAAVHSWLGKTKEPWINLGAHTESVRRYLLGETAFPSEMALSLSILPTPSAAVISFHLPYETVPEAGCNTFHFYIAGLNYTLWVGPNIPAEVRICLSAKPNVLLVFDCAKDITRRFKEAYESARKLRKPSKG